MEKEKDDENVSGSSIEGNNEERNMKLNVATFSSASILIILSLVSGCIDQGNEDNTDDQIRIKTAWEQLNIEGSAIGDTRGEPQRTTHTISLTVEKVSLVQIIVNITYTDGDEDTEADEIHSVELRAFNEEGEEAGTVSIPGGDMPFSGQLILKSTNGTTFDSSFEVIDECTMKAGEDRWIGPIFWVGTPDMGYDYVMDISYEYIEADNQE